MAGLLAGDQLSEGAVVCDVVAGVVPGEVLALGNSLVVREVDVWAGPPAGGVVVLHQRGASGIDGLIASAAGSAIALGRRVVLLLGDVSFRHDVSSLAVARDVGAPLTVVILDNGGGRIFEQLPAAACPELGPCFERFTTPSDVSSVALATGFGVEAVAVDGRVALRDAMRAARVRPGCTVIEAVVAPDDARRQRRQLRVELDRQNGGIRR